MSGAAAIVAAATLYWASSSAPPGVMEAGLAAPSPAAMNEARRSPTTRPTRAAQIAQADIGPALQPAQAAADPEASTIADYTAQKYQFLLDDLRYLDATQLGQLQRALQRRERLTGEKNSAGQLDAFAKVEDQIRALLHAADYATYELLKESDLELYKLNEYAGGISNVAPLSAGDRESILTTKLAYKARYRQLLRDSGLERSDLGAVERDYAYSTTSRALEEYRRSYLEEVRQYLSNEEQFALLSNYETTEFRAELAQLKSMAGTSSQGGS